MMDGEDLIPDDKVEKILYEDLTFRTDARDFADDLYEYYENGNGDRVTGETNAVIAYWAEEVLAKHFGSRNYGYSIKTGQHNNSVYLAGTSHRDAPTLGKYNDDLHAFCYDISGMPKREYKNNVRDWLAGKITEVVQEARVKIDRIEMKEEV